MTVPLSMALRTRVAVALEEGERVRAAAKRFGVSGASAVRIGQRHCVGRGQGHGKIGGLRPRVLAGEADDRLPARLADRPDLTIRALTAELAARGVTVAHDQDWRSVRRAGQMVRK